MVDSPHIAVNFHPSLVRTELCVLLVISMLWWFLFSIACWCILVVHVTLFLTLSKSFCMLDSSLPLGVLCDCVVHVSVVQVILAGWTSAETLCTLLVQYPELLLLWAPLNLSIPKNQIRLPWNCRCVPMNDDCVASCYHPWLSCTSGIICLCQVPILINS